MAVKNEGGQPPLDTLDFSQLSDVDSEPGSPTLTAKSNAYGYAYVERESLEHKQFHGKQTLPECPSDIKRENCESGSIPLSRLCKRNKYKTRSKKLQQKPKLTISDCNQLGRKIPRAAKSAETRNVEQKKSLFQQIDDNNAAIVRRYEDIVNKGKSSSASSLVCEEAFVLENGAEFQLDTLKKNNDSKEYLNQQKRIIFVESMSCCIRFEALINEVGFNNIDSVFECWGVEYVRNFLCDNTEIIMKIADSLADCIICVNLSKPSLKFNQLKEWQQMEKIKSMEYTPENITANLNFFKDSCDKQMFLLYKLRAFVRSSKMDSYYKSDFYLDVYNIEMLYYRCICNEYLTSDNDFYADKIIEVFSSKFTPAALTELVTHARKLEPYRNKIPLTCSLIQGVCFTALFNIVFHESVFFLLENSKFQYWVEQGVGKELSKEGIYWLYYIVSQIDKSKKRNDSEKQIMILKKSIEKGLFKKIKDIGLQEMEDEEKLYFSKQLESAEKKLGKILIELKEENEVLKQEREQLAQQLIESEELTKKMAAAKKAKQVKLRESKVQKSEIPCNSHHLAHDPQKQQPKKQVEQPNIDRLEAKFMLEQQVLRYFSMVNDSGKSLEQSLAELEALGESYSGVEEQQKLVIIKSAQLDLIFSNVQVCLGEVGDHFSLIKQYIKIAKSMGFTGTFDLRDEFVKAIRALPGLQEKLSELYEKLEQVIQDVKKVPWTGENEKAEESIMFMAQSIQDTLNSLKTISKASEDISKICEWRKEHLSKIYYERQQQQSYAINPQQLSRNEEEVKLTKREIEEGASNADSLVKVVEKFNSKLQAYKTLHTASVF